MNEVAYLPRKGMTGVKNKKILLAFFSYGYYTFKQLQLPTTMKEE